MQAIASLWLPILVAAIAVFVASSLVHMVLRWHQSDHRRVANEDAVMAALRDGNIARGQYILPWCEGMQAAQDEAMQAKYRAGPIAVITVFRPGMPQMGGMLLKWFVFNLVIAIICAVAILHLFGAGVGAPYAAHLAGVLSFLAYGGGSAQQAIWMGKPWSTVAKDLLDALIYAAATAAVFYWLWPGATA